MKIDISFPKDICPYCYGTGRLKAMQSATAYEDRPIRYKDTSMKCNHCKGTGIKSKP